MTQVLPDISSRYTSNHWSTQISNHRNWGSTRGRLAKIARITSTSCPVKNRPGQERLRAFAPEGASSCTRECVHKSTSEQKNIFQLKNETTIVRLVEVGSENMMKKIVLKHSKRKKEEKKKKKRNKHRMKRHTKKTTLGKKSNKPNVKLAARLTWIDLN